MRFEIIGDPLVSVIVPLAVGGQVFDADGGVWHAGVLIPRGSPVRVRQDILLHPGHASEARNVANFSAVSGGCMLTRRAAFDEVGGFRPESSVGFSDVDYCLRIRQRGQPHRLHAVRSTAPGDAARDVSESWHGRVSTAMGRILRPVPQRNLATDGSFLTTTE